MNPWRLSSTSYYVLWRDPSRWQSSTSFASVAANYGYLCLQKRIESTSTSAFIWKYIMQNVCGK